MKTQITPFFFLVLLLLIQNDLFSQKKITVKEVTEATFRQNSVNNVNWANDGQYYTSLTENKIVRYRTATGEAVETLFDGATNNPKLEIEDYVFSQDEKKILLKTANESIYRRSYKAIYYVYDVLSKQTNLLSKGGKQSYATFSPDASKVAFCRENNLFVVDLKDFSETAITTNGKFNFTINGSADWVYEEEFSFAQGFFWSPDGQKIAFYTFDESAVKEYNMQMWEDKGIYPNDYRFKYPKAGESNSTVEISVYDLAKKQSLKMDLGTEKDIYIPRVDWTKNSNLLSIRRLNRLQNRLELLHADAATGKTTVAVNEQDEAYVDIEQADLVYLKDGKHFVMTSEKSGFKHLYLHTLDGKLVRQITQGNWEIADFLGVDESTKKPIFYFTSTEVSSLERHFYSIDIEGKNKTQISKTRGVHTINLSPDFKYFLDYHSNAEQPLQVHLFETKGFKLVKTLEDNKKLVETAKEFGLAKKEFFSIKTSDNLDLQAFMLKPTNFDASKKYPVLMYVYGGPSSQNVLDSWGGGHYYFHQLLTQKDYIVVCVDNRGTGARGAKFKKSTYKVLGKYETQDQIEAAQFLGKQAFIDKDRIGIWGWSYGGYMSSLCILLGNETFKAAIAVAPVTTWRFYDTVYTERFLQRPQDNTEGYDQFSPINHVEKLKGKYFLIHGTGDDNVHFQNAVMFQNALIKAGKQFESFYYPNRNHGIYGGNTRSHLYQMMTDYVLRSL